MLEGNRSNNIYIPSIQTVHYSSALISFSFIKLFKDVGYILCHSVALFQDQWKYRSKIRKLINQFIEIKNLKKRE